MKRLLAVMGVAACGGGSDATTDAPPTDGPGAVDGPSTPDATPTGLVTVQAYWSLSEPDANATAIFVDVDGTVVQDALVAADGTASAMLHAGGSVTVLQGFTEGTTITHGITTFRAVKPGDHLVVGLPPDNPYWIGAQTDTMVLNVPPAPVGNYILASSPCYQESGSPGNQLGIHFYASCDPSPFDLLVTSGTPPMPTDPIAYVWQPGNVHVVGGTLDLADAWQPMSVSNVTMTNVPDYLHHLVGRTDSAIGRQSWTVNIVDYDMPAPGTQTMTLQYPGAGPRTFLVLEALRQGRPVDRIAHFASAYDSVNIDFDAIPVPRPTVLTQTPTGATWTETAGTADARMLRWEGRWHSGPYTHWATERIVEPWSAGASTTLPTLPAAHAAEDPTTVASGLELMIIDLYYVEYTNTDYDGVRTLPLGPEAIEYNFRDVDHDAVLAEATQ